jgi:hypothetical protein
MRAGDISNYRKTVHLSILRTAGSNDIIDINDMSVFMYDTVLLRKRLFFRSELSDKTEKILSIFFIYDQIVLVVK